jgi:hypothetical protein
MKFINRILTIFEEGQFVDFHYLLNNTAQGRKEGRKAK